MRTSILLILIFFAITAFSQFNTPELLRAKRVQVVLVNSSSSNAHYIPQVTSIYVDSMGIKSKEIQCAKNDSTITEYTYDKLHTLIRELTTSNYGYSN